MPPLSSSRWKFFFPLIRIYICISVSGINLQLVSVRYRVMAIVSDERFSYIRSNFQLLGSSGVVNNVRSAAHTRRIKSSTLRCTFKNDQNYIHIERFYWNAEAVITAQTVRKKVVIFYFRNIIVAVFGCPELRRFGFARDTAPPPPHPQ